MNYDHTERVAIVGGGPVGALLAALLADKGLDIDLYERRPDSRRIAQDSGRSINLAVSARGLHALAQLGLDGEVLDCTVPMFGRMVHAVLGNPVLQAYGKDASQCIHSMSRAGLNKILLSRAEQTGRVRCHFSHRLVGYDFATQVARFRDESTAAERTIAAPVIFGTDGSASALRNAMVENGATEHFAPLDFGYKELTLRAGPNRSFLLEKHALHIWPRGRFMLIALPNPDGTFTCTLFLPHHSDGDTPAFSTLRDDLSVRDLFLTHFPDIATLMPDLVAQFHSGSVGQMATLRAAPWHLEAALLLGDAAHAIVPFFGQGMNAGFESCVEFVQNIDAAAPPRSVGQWRTLMAQFWPRRKVNCDAIADLALENFVEMRDKIADPTYLLHREVELAVQKLLGSTYWTRYQLVSFSRVPYSEALRIGQMQATVLAQGCSGHTEAQDVDVKAVASRMNALIVPALSAMGL